MLFLITVLYQNIHKSVIFQIDLQNTRNMRVKAGNSETDCNGNTAELFFGLKAHGETEGQIYIHTQTECTEEEMDS